MSTSIRHDHELLLESLLAGKLPRNLHWADVLELIKHIGEVVHHDGNEYTFVVATHRIMFKRPHHDTLDVEEMKQRFLVVQAVEAARTVEDHVITDMREADVGSILGFGFAPFTGGTLSYIDFMGTKTFVELCHKLEAKYGSRFTPPKLLIEMAAKGETFYGRFPPKKQAAA